MPATDRAAADRRYYLNKKLREAGGTVKVKKGRPAHTTEIEKKVLVQIRMPLTILGQIQRMVNEAVALGTYPWRTQTAMVNAMIFRGLETLKGDPMIDEALAYLRTVNQIELVSRHRKEAHAAMSLLRSEIAALLSINAVDEAAAVYQSAHAAILNISQNVWRDWMLHQMETSYPKLAKMKARRPSLASASRSTSQTSAGERRRQERRSSANELQAELMKGAQS